MSSECVSNPNPHSPTIQILPDSIFTDMATASPVDCCPETKISTTDEEFEMAKLLQRAQWLRAAILGANDGLLSTTSLMLGVGAVKEDQWLMIISGIAGALAGACSMAVGEFVSVSTQRDIELATIGKCNLKEDVGSICDTQGVKRTGVAHDSNDFVHQEPMPVVVDSIGASPDVTKQKLSPRNNFVGHRTPRHTAPPASTPLRQMPQSRSPLMRIIATDAQATPLQEAKREDSMVESLPSPYKAAVASGLAFLCGSLVPLLSALVSKQNKVRVVAIVVVTSIALVIFGATGARLGGSSVRVSAMRVLLGGWISMAVTYGLLKPLDKDHHKVHKGD